MKQFAICVDMDDTLIPNAHTYFQPQLEMTGLITWDLGYSCPNPVTIINRATEKQVSIIKECGFISKHNFPMSYVDIYVELCQEIGREPNDKIKSAIFMAGVKYFIKDYVTYPGVIETLENLNKISDYKLTKIIVTRGDESVQQYKIDNTKIRKYFDHIEIVPIKNKQTYLDIIEKYKLKPLDTIMVGDSLRNDIVPALEAGLHAVHITAIDASDWEKSLGHIEVKCPKDQTFGSIKEFTGIIEYIGKIFKHNTN